MPVKFGVITAALTVAPTHGSIFSFLAALYATMIGRKYSTERHIESTKTQEADLSADRKSTTPKASSMEAIAMISEAPSSTPRSGRNESERYSKKLSSQAKRPRPLARSSALTSASDCGRGVPPPVIDGRFMMSE